MVHQRHSTRTPNTFLRVSCAWRWRCACHDSYVYSRWRSICKWNGTRSRSGRSWRISISSGMRAKITRFFNLYFLSINVDDAHGLRLLANTFKMEEFNMRSNMPHSNFGSISTQLAMHRRRLFTSCCVCVCHLEMPSLFYFIIMCHEIPSSTGRTRNVVQYAVISPSSFPFNSQNLIIVFFSLSAQLVRSLVSEMPILPFFSNSKLQLFLRHAVALHAGYIGYTHIQRVSRIRLVIFFAWHQIQ